MTEPYKMPKQHIALHDDHCVITLTVPYKIAPRAFADLSNPEFWDNLLDSVRAGLAGRDIGIEKTRRRIVTEVVKEC